MLRRLSRLDDAWRDAEALAAAVTLPELRRTPPVGPYTPGPDFFIEHMLLRPLADFGLLAMDGGPRALAPARYRRTALFPHFLTWSFDTLDSARAPSVW